MRPSPASPLVYGKLSFRPSQSVTSSRRMSRAVHERIVGLFREHFGTDPEAVLEMAGDGSSRQYHRIRGPGEITAIGAVAPDRPAID